MPILFEYSNWFDVNDVSKRYCDQYVRTFWIYLIFQQYFTQWTYNICARAFYFYKIYSPKKEEKRKGEILEW